MPERSMMKSADDANGDDDHDASQRRGSQLGSIHQSNENASETSGSSTDQHSLFMF